MFIALGARSVSITCVLTEVMAIVYRPLASSEPAYLQCTLLSTEGFVVKHNEPDQGDTQGWVYR